MRALLVAGVLVLPLIGYPASCEAQDLKALNDAQKNTSVEFRKQFCSLSRAAGVPIGIDPALRQQVDAAATPEKVREMLLPVARVNNAFLCFCTEGDARKELRCQ